MKSLPCVLAVAISCLYYDYNDMSLTGADALALNPQSFTGSKSLAVNRRHVLQTASLATAGVLSPVGYDAATAASGLQPIATLSDGTKFPLVSFGLQIYNDDAAYKLTRLALDVGYRNFFASVLAGNQKGFARAVKDSGVDRKDLFICGSVVSNRALGYKAAYEDTTAGWKRNMAAFATGDIQYLDQIMLDYPGPDAASIQGQWASFQAMHQQGLTKTLSVSNFSPAQLDTLLVPTKSSGDAPFELTVPPVVNQLPYSVAYHPAKSSVAENAARGVLVQAWAPLGGSLGGRFTPSMKDTCAVIGKKYQKSFAQVALRWILQTGASFTTQSQNKAHFEQDLDIFDFELTPQDMEILSALA